MGVTVKDRDWVRQSFLVNKGDLELVDQQNRTFSTASLKFTDTTPGGNFAINPPPQFTRFADLKPAENSPFKGSKKLGRYYSEAIDDTSQLIHMRFGVPEFNSLTTFFSGFYNTGAGRLARTGRADGFFYNIGKVVGMVVPLMSWKLLAFHYAGVAFRFLTQKPSSRFYYLKPTMPMYWSAVQTIVNQIAVNRGIVPRIASAEVTNAAGEQHAFDAAARAKLHAAMPEIINKDGSIDVYAIANRAQRLARAQHKKMLSMGDESSFDLNKRIQKLYTEDLTQTAPTYDSYLSKWLKTTPSKPTGAPTAAAAPAAPAADGAAPVQDAGQAAVDNGTFSESRSSDPAQREKDTAGLFDFFTAELDDGSAFATFRVNYTGSIGESFSNTVGESEVQGKFNSMSSSSRSTSFNFAGGNLDDGFIGKMVGGVVNAVKDFASGVADGIGISGLAALAGGAFVDIPKHWQSSSAQLPRSTYTINLSSPYGNAFSQLINIDLPLAMLLAGALPMSTGKQSYTSPFILELYDKGRCQTRLGMIDSLQITRGTGNTGFHQDGLALGIEVTFSIVDMSSIMHMPITEGFSMSAMQKGADIGAALGGGVGAVTGGVPGAVTGVGVGAAVGGAAGYGLDVASAALDTVVGIWDEDTVFTDYMATLAGMGLADQIYSLRKLKINLTKKLTEWNKLTSPAAFASFAGDIWPARMVSAVFKGVAR